MGQQSREREVAVNIYIPDIDNYVHLENSQQRWEAGIVMFGHNMSTLVALDIDNNGFFTPRMMREPAPLRRVTDFLNALYNKWRVSTGEKSIPKLVLIEDKFQCQSLIIDPATGLITGRKLDVGMNQIISCTRASYFTRNY